MQAIRFTGLLSVRLSFTRQAVGSGLQVAPKHGRVSSVEKAIMGTGRPSETAVFTPVCSEKLFGGAVPCVIYSSNTAALECVLSHVFLFLTYTYI